MVFGLNTLIGCISNFHSFFIFRFIFSLCISASVCASCLVPVKDKRVSKIPLELELQEVVNLLVWMMGTECQYPGRAESILPH